MNSIVLDTNAYSFLINGDRVIQNELNKSDLIYICPIVLGELYAGFIKGSKKEKNNIILKKFLSMEKINIPNVSLKTSLIYAELFVKLSKIGKPIPTNDIWIAASAIETNSVLITYDKHFLKVPGIRVWNNLAN